jgi:fibronectin-binding autotransporter adhesin
MTALLRSFHRVVFNYIPSGSGADVHIQSGLVVFNGNNVYSGQTILEGGTLQAQDAAGIYWDSNINFKGTTTSNAVLMSNGLFNRYVGTLSNRVQWTGSGGFAAVAGDLNVNLSNGQTMSWNIGGFVKNGDALYFWSRPSHR